MHSEQNTVIGHGSVRLAFAGMVPENGHPFSWGAIINGVYDPEVIARYGYSGINDYLGEVPKAELGLPGAQVTHIWCDRMEDAEAVAQSVKIPNIVSDPKELIGQVDAVIIPTDRGEEHWARAQMFIEAGLPVFIDKPLADSREDGERFEQQWRGGASIMSSSCMRYAREFVDLKQRLSEVGDVRLITVTCPKSWERYGIHALESVYWFLEPGGWLSVRNSGTAERNLVHLKHVQGVDVVLSLTKDLYGALCHVEVYGTKGHIGQRFEDTYYAFRTQLEGFLAYLRGETALECMEETLEQVKIIAAGVESRERGGVEISLR